MKYFVFADVHGFYTILKDELNRLGFDYKNPNHMLISLGDNFDRGTENYEMFQFLKEMKELNKIILVKGNHEDLMLEMLYRRKPIFRDLTNGTYDACCELVRKSLGINRDDIFYDDPYLAYSTLRDNGFIDFIYDMKDFYETPNFIFTHGFIPITCDELGNYDYMYMENWREADSSDFNKARWVNGIEMSIKYNIGEKGKKIVVGHFHSSYGHVRREYSNLTPTEYRQLEFSKKEYFLPYIDDNIIALDACTVKSKMVNVFIIDE